MTIPQIPPVTPTAAAFPAEWTEIEAAGVPFHFDAMHFPFPVSPLMSSVSHAFEEGYSTALHEHNVPIAEMQVRHVNHYRYERVIPRIPASEEEAAAWGELTEKTLEREISRMLDRWFVEHRPALETELGRLRHIDLGSASPESILEVLDELDAGHRHLWLIHFRIVWPMLMAMQLFSEFLADLFDESPAAAHGLMVGGLSETIKAAFGLADLATLARTLGLADVIRSTPDDSLIAALENAPGGRMFLARLDAYLEEYGLRQDLFDLATPTWRENPSFALASVRNYLETGYDPRAEHEAMTDNTQQAFDAVHARLVSFPAAVRGQFDAMVQHARQGAFLQEEHNFYIDQQGLSLLRLAYRQVGQRLVAFGLLDDADDVFMLRIDEIRSALEQLTADTHAGDLSELARQRRAELGEAAAMDPPPIIGDTTGAPPPDTVGTRALTAFFGGPPQRSETPGQLRGNPGSRGIASGAARIARTLEEAREVRPGEILVAVTTMPAWTPLFGVAAAVVTETGGALSHCAIVAREYGIPAVVGAYGATRSISTGQRVTVDGTLGIVTIVD
jgi:rifampicin phosphotransferase